jgi:hydrogenase maturation protease
MNRCAVIGFGNPLRQDDGMGWRAAELVEAGIPEGSADISICHQLTPEFAVKLAGAPLVIFLDAAVDQAPGEVTERPVEPGGELVSSHSLSPGQLLSLVQLLYRSAPPAVLISGGALEMNSGESMTETGELCAALMAKLALNLLDRHRIPQELQKLTL